MRLVASIQIFSSSVLVSWLEFWRGKILLCLAKKQWWTPSLLGSRSPKRDMPGWVCCCNMYISNHCLLRICFVLAVQLSLVWVVATYTGKSTMLWHPERGPKVQVPFSRRDVVCSIGHHVLVGALLELKLPRAKCCLSPTFLGVCNGTTVRFMLRTSSGATVESFVGSLVTLQAACDVLQAKALLWLESMTWGLLVI